MVKITKIGNGIEFDATELTGSGDTFAKKMFVPVHAIEKIKLHNDRVIGQDSLGNEWNLNKTGSGGAYPVDTIEGVAVSDLQDLYNKLIALI